MKNKIELKKMCITSCIVIIIFLITFSILIYKQYKTYTYNFNQKIAGIIDNVLEKYPDIEKREIVEILNSSDKTNNEILREYGIELDKDSVILENNTDFQKFIIIDVSTLIVFILILSIIVFKYNHSESKKINEITKYIEEINRGNYKLNIEENTEDELSILKNELYKITIKLKEVAENMDKVILLPGGAYNFGSETTQSIYEVTNKFVDMLGKRLIVKDAPARQNLWMDCSKARKYGVEFSSVIDGLERCARDYKL